MSQYLPYIITFIAAWLLGFVSRHITEQQQKIETGLSRYEQVKQLCLLVQELMPERYHLLPDPELMMDETEPVHTYLQYLLEEGCIR